MDGAMNKIEKRGAQEASADFRIRADAAKTLDIPSDADSNAWIQAFEGFDDYQTKHGADALGQLPTGFEQMMATMGYDVRNRRMLDTHAEVPTLDDADRLATIRYISQRMIEHAAPGIPDDSQEETIRGALNTLDALGLKEADIRNDGRASDGVRRALDFFARGSQLGL